MLPLIVLFLVGTASAISCPKAVPYDFCSEYEVLHTTPPCCESTCEYECCRVLCPKMLVYEPTCVCLEGYVRHQGECIPKSSCPAVASYAPAPYQTSPAPCETTTPRCETTTPPCPTTKPPCRTTQPPCATSPQPCNYSPGYPRVTYIPPPPPPSYRTIPPYRNPPPTHPTSAPSKPCVTTMSPYKATPPCTTKPPCPTTTPCPPTTTPCPPTTTPCPPTPCPTPPDACAACEELIFTQTCCEPTCDFDCSGVDCPLILLEQATCACRPGLVRYEGHCIEPSDCPKSASRYRLYVPVASQCLQCRK